MILSLWTRLFLALFTRTREEHEAGIEAARVRYIEWPVLYTDEGGES